MAENMIKTKSKLKNNNGRSMLEMLGVLAIIGVLSIGAVTGFKTAINKHKINEILYAANTRAAIISMKIQEDESINIETALNEFNDDDVYGVVFGTPKKVGDTQFKIPVTLQDASFGDGSICTQIKNTIVEGSDITVQIDEKCTRFLYNNDLSGNVIPNEEEEEENNNCEKGYKGENCDECAKHYTKYDGSDTCELEPSGSECLETVGCIVTSGEGTAVCNNGYCECTEGVWTSNTQSELNKGTCTILDGETGCLTNKDCNDGSEKGSKYCHFSDTIASLGPITRGTCIDRSTEFNGAIVLDGHTYIVTYYSTEPFNWWSAKNFCAAYGKRMMSLSDYGCVGVDYCAADSTFQRLMSALTAAKSKGEAKSFKIATWSSTLTSDPSKVVGIHRTGRVNNESDDTFLRSKDADVFCR